MGNFAKERLETLLGIMKQYNWARYHFPGGNTLRFTQLLVLLARGQALEFKAFPERMLKPGRCWDNAKARCAADPKLEYWEGVIANEDSAWPTPHAWNMRGGKIVDATVDSSKFDYFGVPGSAF